MTNSKIENILIKIFLVISGVVFAGLFTLSFVFSYVNNELLDEHVYRVRDNLIVNLAALFILFVILYIVRGKGFTLKFGIKKRTVVIWLSFVAVLLSVVWVLISGTEPQADQWKLCNAASQLNQGDYSGFGKGNYLAECPHQLGVISLMRVLFLLFGDWNYMSFQLLSALAVGLIIYYTYRFTLVLTDDENIGFIAAILVFICLPVYLYTIFVYGEILSIAISLMALYKFCQLYKDFSIMNIVVLAVLVATMLLARKNTSIIAVAMIGVAIVRPILDRNLRKSLIALAVVLGVIIQSVSMTALYSQHKQEDGKAMPSILWVAMGTTDYGRFAGWYDGMNFEIFEHNNCDPKAASIEAKQVISEFAGKCIDNPGYAANFYMRKISSQWIAPMYQSIVMNNNIAREQTSFADLIFYDKTAWKVLDFYMNIYQLVLYLGVLYLLISAWNARYTLQFLVGMIAVYGGFLFSIIWEAKSRYILPYLVIMIPYSVVGLYNLSQRLSKE